jgi:hypothetical protein
MYFKLKIFVRKKLFAKVRFIVDEHYLDDFIKRLNNSEQFIEIDNIIIHKNLVKYVKFKTYSKKT